MASIRRKFSEAEKLNILESAERLGVTAVLREHRLSYSVFARWKGQYRRNGSDPNNQSAGARTRSELRQMLEENVRLKRIIADQVIELERKEEELRKYKPPMR
jgi:putative transposase